MLTQIKQQLEEYSDYPQNKYSIVISALTRSYPGLLDEEQGNCPKFKWKLSLMNKLRSKFKYLRKSQKHDTDLRKTMKAKYGAASKSLSSSNAVELAKRRIVRHLLKLPDSAGAGETSASVLLHKEKLLREWQTLNPREDVMNDRLERTVWHQVRLYDQSPSHVLQDYPMLGDCFQIVNEAKLFFGFKLREAREQWFSELRTAYLLRKLKKARDSKSYTFAKDSDSGAQKISYIVWMLLLLFREDPKSWIEVHDVGNSNLLKFACTDNEPLSFSSEDCNFLVKGLDSIICRNAPDLPSALDVLIAAYYLYNVQFPSHPERTLRFITEEIVGVPSTKALPNRWPQ